jgi:hypothetical protein
MQANSNSSQVLSPAIHIHVIENSWLAKIAARRLQTICIAVVVNRTIHLWNISREDFLGNNAWVRHEIAHVKQYRNLGVIRFLLLYSIESIRKGYVRNRFEVEAREMEHNQDILEGVYFS